MTKREMFQEIRKVVASNAEMVEFIDHELELLDRKAATPRKLTAKQIENLNFKANILVALASADKTVTFKEVYEICPQLAELSPQRVTHMLTDLINEGRIVRTVVKKVPYYRIVTEGGEVD